MDVNSDIIILANNSEGIENYVKKFKQKFAELLCIF